MHMLQQNKLKSIIVKKVIKPSLRKFFQMVKCMVLPLRDRTTLPLQAVLQCIFLAFRSPAKSMAKFYFFDFFSRLLLDMPYTCKLVSDGDRAVPRRRSASQSKTTQDQQKRS